jgi:hypothetical protein
MSEAIPQRYSAAVWCCIFCVLFGLRVLAQAVQHWSPQPFLPPFAAFQGSSLPYPLLLSAQVAILVSMVSACRRVLTGMQIRSSRICTALSWFGSAYMAASVLRIAVGVLIPGAAPWFRAWISGCFHVVLAAFVLALARLYRTRPQE